MSQDTARSSPPEIDYLAFLKRAWTLEDFVKLLLFAGVCLVLYYFYGVIHIYQNMPLTWWAWGRYAPQYNFEHAKLVPVIIAFLLWYHHEELVRAKKEGSNLGLLFVAIGCLIFALGARTLQGRMGMLAGPFLLYGIVLYLWGRQVARILLFPIVFLIFMIPVSAIEQATFRLQFMITGIASFICNSIGIRLFAVGTTLRAVDNSFGFEIAEGCSGIRSLMAMIMVTAVYVHLTENKLWKKVTILLCSTGFAIIGNAGRIVSIFIVAKFFGASFAGGRFHEASGFISFPIALLAMIGFSRLLDLPYFETARALKETALKPNTPAGGAEGNAGGDKYDY